MRIKEADERLVAGRDRDRRMLIKWFSELRTEKWSGADVLLAGLAIGIAALLFAATIFRDRESEDPVQQRKPTQFQAWHILNA